MRDFSSRAAAVGEGTSAVVAVVGVAGVVAGAVEEEAVAVVVAAAGAVAGAVEVCGKEGKPVRCLQPKNRSAGANPSACLGVFLQANKCSLN